MVRVIASIPKELWLFRSLISDTRELKLFCCSAKDNTFGSEILKSSHRRRQAKELKLYVEYLFVSQLSITVSFLPIDWSSLQATLLASAAYLGKIPTEKIHFRLALPKESSLTRWQAHVAFLEPELA